jgi:hypothetical protein
MKIVSEITLPPSESASISVIKTSKLARNTSILAVNHLFKEKKVKKVLTNALGKMRAYNQLVNQN